MIDHSQAIAAFLVDTQAASRPDFDLASIGSRWPSASAEEIERGLRNAVERIEGRLAVIWAENACRANASIPPMTRACMVADVVRALSNISCIEETTVAFERIGQSWPELPWSVLMEGLRATIGEAA